MTKKSNTDEQWELYFEQAVDHFKAFRKWPLGPFKDKKTVKIKKWLILQLNAENNGLLDSDKIEKFKRYDPDFFTDMFSEHWDDMFEAACQYYQKFGEWPSGKSQIKYTKLLNWVRAQRISYKNNTLHRRRVEKLTAFDASFFLNRHDFHWRSNYEEFSIFYNQHRSYPEDASYAKLYKWMYAQIIALRGGRLSDEKVNLLKSIDPLFLNKISTQCSIKAQKVRTRQKK